MKGFSASARAGVAKRAKAEQSKRRNPTLLQFLRVANAIPSPLSLKLAPSMNRRHSKRQVLVRLTRGHDEARLANHLCEPVLRREPLDRLDEVLVRIPIGGDEVTEVGDHLERVGLVRAAGGR